MDTERIRAFYRWSLALPLVVPVLAIVFLKAVPWAQSSGLAGILALIVFGLQEAVLAAIHGADEVTLRIFVFGSALILMLGYAYVLVVFGLRALLFGQMNGPAGIRGSLKGLDTVVPRDPDRP